jgi:hypothetical protein
MDSVTCALVGGTGQRLSYSLASSDIETRVWRIEN